MSRLLDKGGKQLGKVSSRVTTLGHALQVPNKFHFDLRVSKLENLPKGRTCVLVVERRDKLECTPTFKADASKTVSLSENLAMDVTLFRKEGKDEFELKKIKIAVRLGDKSGKTVSKIHIDLANYAKVPNGSTEIKLKMTGGAVVFASLESNLIKSGRSNGPSSLFSAMTTGSGGLGGSGDLDDLDDLDLGEDGDLFDATTVPSKPSNRSAEKPRPHHDNTMPPPPVKESLKEKAERLTRANVRLEDSIHRSERDGHRLREDIAEASERLQALDAQGPDVVNKDAERELTRLKEKIHALEAANTELEKEGEQIKLDLEDARELHASLEERAAEQDTQKSEEAEQMRKETVELEAKLRLVQLDAKREPMVAELHTEIRTTRLQLDLIKMETQKTLNEIEHQSKSRGQKRSGRQFWWFRL